MAGKRRARRSAGGANFGRSVTVWSSLLAVGAPFERSNATGINGDQTDSSVNAAGAVYLFSRSGGIWTQKAYLKASNTGVNDQFGTTIVLIEEEAVKRLEAEIDEMEASLEPLQNFILPSGSSAGSCPCVR